MKKIIKEYQVFNYEELNEKAKEKAFLDYSYNNNDFFDFYYDSFKDNLLENVELLDRKYIKSLDIDNCDVDYGGYVLLSGKIDIKDYINYHKSLEHLKPLIDIFDNETASIKNNNSKTNYIDLYGIDFLSSNYYYEIASEKNLDNYEELLDELQKNLDEELKNIEYVIYKDLKKDFYYYNSDEYFKELCKSNNYTFLVDGTMFNE